jgi:hypothetical protein
MQALQLQLRASSCLLPLACLSVIHFVRWHSSYIYCILLPSQLAYVCVVREIIAASPKSFSCLLRLPISLFFCSVLREEAIQLHLMHLLAFSPVAICIFFSNEL